MTTTRTRRAEPVRSQPGWTIHRNRNRRTSTPAA